MVRTRFFAVTITMLVLSGCQGGRTSAPCSAEGAPAAPTELERAMLGPDANDPYFLARFRSCSAFGSYTYCQAEMYGGLPH